MAKKQRVDIDVNLDVSKLIEVVSLLEAAFEECAAQLKTARRALERLNVQPEEEPAP